MESLPSYQLQIGELIASPEPAVITTVLGSCVSVCLFSPKNRTGGMTHFALPKAPVPVAPEESFRYGDLAIPGLIRELCRLTGEKPGQLLAKVAGGAESSASQLEKFKVGEANLRLAKEILSGYRIQVVGESSGGCQGRKVIFHTGSGRLQVASLRETSIHTTVDMRTVICIGASTGGTEAIKDLLTALPEKIPPILVVQHIPRVFSAALAERLNSLCPFEVKEAKHGDVLKAGRVLIAPGDLHMEVRRSQASAMIRLSDAPPVNRHRPSVDKLFFSAAEIFGKKSIGIILTGMGSDGAKGLLEMRRQGARTIVQDEDSSVVYGMPRAAFEAQAADTILPLDEIPTYLVSILSHRSKT